MALFNYQAVDIAELRKNNKLRTSNDKANFRYESQNRPQVCRKFKVGLKSCGWFSTLLVATKLLTII